MYEIGQLVVCDGYIRFVSSINQDDTFNVLNIWSPESEEVSVSTKMELPKAKHSQWHVGLIKAANRLFPTFVENGNNFFVKYPEEASSESH